ncbi:carbohydrate ABC transporter permease [Streptomyces sp. CWNU-52B]|uniref:carbohydrate ABC transporter permease n=1 Tax=unclassified Streptomyces TaxID=2593676 RepID=UPI0039C46E3C
MATTTQTEPAPTGPPPAEPRGAGRIRGTARRGLTLHVSLVLGVLLSAFPFYWAVIMATHTSTEIFSYPPKLLPGSHFGDNLSKLFDSVDFFGSMANSLLVAVSVTFLVLFFDSLAAFVFAKFEFPGRRVLFAAMMAIFMVPAQLAAIPQFVIMAKLGWIGSMTALIVPAAANAFGIFWMRQYMKSAIHDELLDASKIDGASFLRQYWHVALPVVRPGLAFLGIFTFMGQWNDYAWPLIALTDPDNVTLQVALSQLNGVHGTTDYGMVMTGAVLALIPLLIVFAIGAKQIIADLGKGAIR